MDKLSGINYTIAASMLLAAVGIYLTLLIFTRLGGKRSFSKMSSFDFAITVAIGSVVTYTIMSSSTSLLEGILGLALLYALKLIIAHLRRFSVITKLVDNQPLLLMDGNKILHQNLKKAQVTEGDLRSKLRESNVLNLNQVKAVVFETTGDISVLHTDNNTPLEDWLIKDVNLK